MRFALACVALALCAIPRGAHAQRDHDAGASASPPPEITVSGYPLPGLGTRVGDPLDGRTWSVTTRIDAHAVTVVASIPGGGLAISLRHPRQGDAHCSDLLDGLLRAEDRERFRVEAPAVFVGRPFSNGVYQQHNATHDAEFSCLILENETWLAAALAQPRAGVALGDAAAMTHALARALVRPHRVGWPVHLDVSGLDVEAPADATVWLFLGRAVGFALPADAIASVPEGDHGGATVTVTRRTGSCTNAWEALHTEGALVDRPGFVPAAFGARIHRITLEDHLREVYCVGSPGGAVLVTATFAGDDGEAMTSLGAMLRRIVAAAGRDDGGHGPPP